MSLCVNNVESILVFENVKIQKIYWGGVSIYNASTGFSRNNSYKYLLLPYYDVGDISGKHMWEIFLLHPI